MKKSYSIALSSTSFDKILDCISYLKLQCIVVEVVNLECSQYKEYIGGFHFFKTVESNKYISISTTLKSISDLSLLLPQLYSLAPELICIYGKGYKMKNLVFEIMFDENVLNITFDAGFQINNNTLSKILTL